MVGRTDGCEFGLCHGAFATVSAGPVHFVVAMGSKADVVTPRYVQPGLLARAFQSIDISPAQRHFDILQRDVVNFARS
jgi:hypothetical protein